MHVIRTHLPGGVQVVVVDDDTVVVSDEWARALPMLTAVLAAMGIVAQSVS